jgi:hypothetical protein
MSFALLLSNESVCFVSQCYGTDRHGSWKPGKSRLRIVLACACHAEHESVLSHGRALALDAI